MEGNEVTTALQGAYAGLVRAVDVARRRPDDRVDATVVVSDLHELRSLMSAAAQLMRSFRLVRYGAAVKWGPAGEPDDSGGLTPAEYVEAADRDLDEAYAHLERAAVSLTAARRRMAELR
ncbi:hypothetical protein ACQHIV_04495 [Kribbella sp. GL6]|uniref:hypothetical protein n=1 Tax=Kribbella sp. GL6 TaxID=3419765 RepID=UPI003CFE2FEF